MAQGPASAAGMQRLFFALWPSAVIQDALAERARILRRETGGRAMRAETLHLTLAFLGDVDASRLPTVKHAADRAEMEAFDFVLDTVGFFPRKGIGWVGPAVVPATLERLASTLRAALLDAGIAFDPKPFVAHVTLLRNIERRASSTATAPITWRVADFALVASVPVGGQREYRVIGRWPGR